MSNQVNWGLIEIAFEVVVEVENPIQLQSELSFPIFRNLPTNKLSFNQSHQAFNKNKSLQPYV
jgi:hypothetical protein